MRISSIAISGFIFCFACLAGCDNSASDTEDFTGIFPAENLKQASEYAVPDENRNSALLIWYDGDLILEKYSNSMTGQTFHPILSGTKSLAGIMAALAVRDGLFTFDTKLGDLIESWDPETERGSITIRELLNLTSGIETAPAGTFQNQNPDVWLNADMAFEKGSTFVYGPTPFYLLSYIFIETLRKNPETYLNDNLFDPLGLSHPNWPVPLAGGYPNLSFGALYPALDWLQLGILLLNKGTLDGTVIIPDDIFSQLLEPSEAAPAYGITFWLNKQTKNGGHYISNLVPEDTFMKSGALGQKLYISPSLNLVIVRFGTTSGFNDHEFFSRLMKGVEPAS